MDRDPQEPTYRVAVRASRDAWSWTLLQGDAVAMTGDAPGLEDAIRRAHFAAGAHAAFQKIGQRRF